MKFTFSGMKYYANSFSENSVGTKQNQLKNIIVLLIAFSGGAAYSQVVTENTELKELRSVNKEVESRENNTAVQESGKMNNAESSSYPIHLSSGQKRTESVQSTEELTVEEQIERLQNAIYSMQGKIFTLEEEPELNRVEIEEKKLILAEYENHLITLKSR